MSKWPEAVMPMCVDSVGNQEAKLLRVAAYDREQGRRLQEKPEQPAS